ncbi:MAG: DUF5016 domain-containing protein [Bacteroidales bacterium]|nr:DUF5016 domain-containing protein [Bacteroidales bacterium]
MNTTIKLVLIGLMAVLTISCQEEELRVRYDESHPVFKKALVAESQITYGDSISLEVEVADDKTPLSTLQIKVVVNDVLLASEEIRTKGNSSAYTSKYSIPFAARMPDNAEVEVHLKSINVEGYTTDTILHNTIAKRVPIPDLWMTFPAAVGIKLTLVDPAKHIYQASNLTLSNNITFRLATKVRSGNRIDWSGMAFGMPNGEFGLIDDINDPQIVLYDPTIYGFNKITVDLLNFTVSGEGRKLEPATALNIAGFAAEKLTSIDNLNVAHQRDWKTLETYMGKDVEITFTGFGNLATSLTPDFFEVTGTDKAKFLGETGVYKLYFLPEANYLYIEQPNARFPNALWLDGVGAGRPVAPFVKTTSWNGNTPEEYSFCRKIAEGVFQATFYANHIEAATIEEPWRERFSMKFFHRRGWEGEEDARTYTISTPNLFAPTESDKGNFVGTPDFEGKGGVYRFTINTNNKTISFVKLN